MKITDIDTNFLQKTSVQEGNFNVFTIPCAPFRLYGVNYYKKTGVLRECRLKTRNKFHITSLN